MNGAVKLTAPPMASPSCGQVEAPRICKWHSDVSTAIRRFLYIILILDILVKIALAVFSPDICMHLKRR